MSKKNRLRRQEAADTAGLGLNSSSAGIFRFPPWIFITGLLAWFCVVYLNYLPSHPAVGHLFGGGFSDFNFTAALSGFLKVLASNVLNVALLFLVIVLSCGIGLALLSFFSITISFAERFIIAIGLGFGVIAYLMLVLGALGALHKNIILPVFLIGSAVSAFKIRVWDFRIGELKREIGEILKLGFAWKALFFLGMLFILLNVIMAFMPEIFYDSLVYHLAAPNYYLLKHQILPMRFLSHSNFPLNMSMLYMLALSLNNEILAKMLHCLMGVLTVPLIYFSVKRIYNAKAALFSALIFCSAPIFSMNSWTCGNDVGLTFFFALAYVTYLSWLKTGEAGQFALFAVFTGIAMGTKYTAVFSVAGLVVSLAIHLWRNYGQFPAIKKLFLYFATVFLFILPWLLKNYIFTGNPIQPFLHTVLGGENLKIIGSGISWRIAGFLSSPWTLTLSGGDSLTYIGPVFLLLLPCLLIFRKLDKLVGHSLIVVCAGYAVWYPVQLPYRYVLPLFIALSVCLGWAAYAVTERFKAFKLLVAAIVAANFMAVFAMALGMGLNGYLSKGMPKDEFLSVTQPSYPNPPYAAIDWINKNLRPDAKVFFIGESRPFYMKRDFISYSVEANVQPLIAYLRKAKDPDDFHAMLRAENFTHLLVNYREAVRNNITYRDFDWTKREREIFDVFWKKYVKQEYFKEGVYVYSILSAAGKTPPLNILAALENDGWKNTSLLKILAENGMWAGCLEEYEMYARYGYDVKKQMEYFKALAIAQDPPAVVLPKGRSVIR